MNYGVYATQTAIVIPYDRLSDWAGFPLTDEEVERLADALPKSTLPEVIGCIADSFHAGPAGWRKAPDRRIFLNTKF